MSESDLADNVRWTVESLAREIARRVVADALTGEKVEHHARQVLYDWFMGDYIPRDETPRARDLE